MIRNAKDNLVNESPSLPDVSAGVMSFFQTIKVGVVEKQQIDGYTEEIVNWQTTQGVRQPFSSEQLAIKSEGERSWKWFTVHCLPDLILETDDQIVLYGTKYRVMEKHDYQEYGYIKYDVVQDTTKSI